jgi:hypothetical protein
MKKIFLRFAILCGLHVPVYAVSFDEIKSTIGGYIDQFVLFILSYLQCLLPAQDRLRSLLVSTYWAGRAMAAKMLGQPPITIYDFLIERAKSNPLEAIGAVTVVFLVFRSTYIAYRSLYRFLYWLLVKRYHK